MQYDDFYIDGQYLVEHDDRTYHYRIPHNLIYVATADNDRADDDRAIGYRQRREQRLADEQLWRPD